MPDYAPAPRIGDLERERAIARLREHVGTGRISLAEFESRLDTVYAARTEPDLAVVVRDLPTPPIRNLSTSTPGRRLAAVWAPWVLTGVICLVIWAATSAGQGHPLYFWPMWVIGPWGAVLALGTLTGGALAGRGCGTGRARPSTSGPFVG